MTELCLSRRAVVGGLLASAGALSPAAAQTDALQGPVTIYAAASLRAPVEDLLTDLRTASNAEVRIGFAASSILARQIEAGAPADIFLSAHALWSDTLIANGFAAENGVSRPYGNRLVVIAPDSSPEPLDIGDLKAWRNRLGAFGLIAIGDPSHVPSGLYTHALWSKLGLLEDLQDRVAATAAAPEAVGLVARGVAPLGVVYASDALLSPDVTVVAEPEPALQPEITYDLILLKDASPAARQVYQYLLSERAAPMFRARGFTAFADQG
ncbi:MAG: molybdate ABC transporter substrate-binding protein [Maricaulaceae bacterium]